MARHPPDVRLTTTEQEAIAYEDGLVRERADKIRVCPYCFENPLRLSLSHNVRRSPDHPIFMFVDWHGVCDACGGDVIRESRLVTTGR